MAACGPTTYLVECYQPGLDGDGATVIDGRLQATVDDLRGAGVEVTWRGSLAILAEETYCYLLTCADVSCVSTVSGRAGLARGHVAEVLLTPWSLGAAERRA